MYKFLLSLVCFVSLSAEMVGGVSVVVQDKAITLYDIEQTMQKMHIDEQTARDVLIRQRLEAIEIEKRELVVSTTEVYDDIRQTAQRNNMSLDEFYEAVLNSNGMNSAELKKEVEKKLLTQKLYSSISYSKLAQPSDAELKEYFALHHGDFEAPASFNVVVYETTNRYALEQQVRSPMFYSPLITTTDKILRADKLSPDLVRLLSSTPSNSFTPIVPNAEGSFLSFYVKDVYEGASVEFEAVKNQIINVIMGQKREEILGDYFTRVKDSTDIKVVRSLK